MKKTRKRGTSIAKVPQRAMVAGLKIRGVPVFTLDDLEEMDERIPGPQSSPDEKMILTREDINNRVRGGKYRTAEELIGDLRREIGPNS
jgi:hypothetical protein